MQAFSQLVSLPFFAQFSSIQVWSDGGLKTKEIIYYFSLVAEDIRKPIEVNFFAPYHGHSVCDAHFGSGKRSLRQTVGSGLVESKQQVMDSFSKLKNTEAGVELADIANRPNVTSLPEQLRKWFQFWFDTKGEIWCRLTHKDQWFKQKIGIIDDLTKLKKPELQQYLRLARVPFDSKCRKDALVELVRDYMTRMHAAQNQQYYQPNQRQQLYQTNK